MIGTMAAIAIAAGVGGGSAASNIYASKKAGDTNKAALAQEERDSARQEALQREQMQVDQRRWDDYLKVHEPIWAGAGNTLKTLYELAGQGGQGPSGPVGPRPSSAPPPSNAMLTPTSMAPNTGGANLHEMATGMAPTNIGAQAFQQTRQPTPQPGSNMPSLQDILAMATRYGGGAPQMGVA
jgi:hypothetical protein